MRGSKLLSDQNGYLKKVKKDDNASFLDYYALQIGIRSLETQIRIIFCVSDCNAVFSRSIVRWLQRKEVPFMGTVRPLPRREHDADIGRKKGKRGTV